MLSFIVFLSCGKPAASSNGLEQELEDFEEIVEREIVTVTSEKTASIQRVEEKSVVMVTEDKSFLSSQASEEVSCTDNQILRMERELSHLNETEKAKHKIKTATTKTDCMIEYLNQKDLGTIEQTYEEYCR